MKTASNRQIGFSLVELVVVVAIIGVIAAIAMPRVSRGSEGASEYALRASLRTLRDAIEMYCAEHLGQLPGANGSASQFWKQLTEKTKADGVSVGGSGDVVYGPYLRAPAPSLVGPNAGASGVIMTTSSPASSAINEAQVSRGWVYNYETGEIIPNTDDMDSSGVEYHTY